VRHLLNCTVVLSTDVIIDVAIHLVII